MVIIKQMCCNDQIMLHPNKEERKRGREREGEKEREKERKREKIGRAHV